MAVDNWLVRYLSEGVKGLATRAGRGRPPILSQQKPAHRQKVKMEIKRHPNSVKTVVAQLEEDLDLAMHPETLPPVSKKNEYRFRRFERLAQVEADGSQAGRAGKAVKDFMAIVSGRADRFILRRRVSVLNESETVLRLVAERRTNRDISANRQKG